MRAKFGLVVSLCFFMGGEIFAAEPNEDFGQATILGPGVLSVSDTITPGVLAGPDTYLGTLDWFGNVEYVDDDNSIYGDGYASGLTGIPINPGGTIDFLVTGCCDSFFSGDHVYSGEYGVFIDVYDFFGDHVESFSDYRDLQAGVVDEFHFSGDETWISGTYDVNIDNLIGNYVGGDVDFYTFTGLTPGSAFAAEVTQETTDGFDSILGWFDDAGDLVDYNDDEGEGVLSLLEGTVPASGKLTFAVTGYDDYEFVGGHDYDSFYTLELTLGSVGVDGDYDSDGDVDGRDFLRWQRGGSPTPYSAADLTTWRNAYPGALVGVTAVPEPTTLWLVAMATCVGLGRQRQR